MRGIGFPVDRRRTDPEVAMECRIHKLVADVALHAGDRVMLVKYEDTSKYDGQPGWFLPDDYLGHLEHPADAAARIVRQQLGIEPPALELGEIESFGNGTWHLIFHFTGRLSESSEPHFGANVAAAQWFQRTGLRRRRMSPTTAGHSRCWIVWPRPRAHLRRWRPPPWRCGPRRMEVAHLRRRCRLGQPSSSQISSQCAGLAGHRRRLEVQPPLVVEEDHVREVDGARRRSACPRPR